MVVIQELIRFDDRVHAEEVILLEWVETSHGTLDEFFLRVHCILKFCLELSEHSRYFFH